MRTEPAMERLGINNNARARRQLEKEGKRRHSKEQKNMRRCEKKNTNGGFDGDCLDADIRLAVYYGIKRMEELLPANPAKAYVSGVFLLK